MMFFASLLGKLSLDAIPRDAITLGGVISMLVVGLGAAAALLYFKKVGWLWREWLTSLDHKKIGIMYLVVAGLMLLRGLADVLLLRAQQATASGSDGIMDSYHFQQIFSAHGTIMIFFVAMGFIFAMINLVLPQMLGSRDVTFPFLNSVSF